MANISNLTENDLFRIEAGLSRRRLIEFIKTVKPNYDCQWFHTLIADKCQAVLEGRIKKLMLFVPPQHGKSEISSRNFPAWALGKDPDLKIVHASYSADLTEGFSRDIQRTIDSEEYAKIFPDTFLNSSNIRTNSRGGHIRTVEKFETVGHSGFYKAVGVCGPLTGNPADIAIIDDPVKDAIEANSITYRERVWDWYVNVLETRLHNDSRVILIMTRWHDDDLAGRLLKKEPNEWEVVSIPSIREDYTNNEDPREIGEALWEQKHNLKKLLRMKELSPRTFASLYQQRPSVEGGNIVKREWFKTIDYEQFIKISKGAKCDFFADTAYTEKTTNDPSAIIGTTKIGNYVYIYIGSKVYMEFPELIVHMKNFVKENRYNYGSSVRIEPKASGLSVVQQLKRDTGLNIIETPTPKDSKETRLNVASSSVESGKIILVNGSWTEDFINEVCKFPKADHDEYVDLLCYAIDFYFNNEEYVIRRVN